MFSPVKSSTVRSQTWASISKHAELSAKCNLDVNLKWDHVRTCICLQALLLKPTDSSCLARAVGVGRLLGSDAQSFESPPPLLLICGSAIVNSTTVNHKACRDRRGAFGEPSKWQTPCMEWRRLHCPTHWTLTLTAQGQTAGAMWSLE
ncbi:unnamed protein product [Pleuronectes platessa]|uniref:Uncharacterized protein n=1 Tax=Pleuronectes platessa TaxID=8262 RepID=A0A9N7TWZ5_PLEPL|nr:unnamed protein product [Pleuronectes platessa]